MALEDGDGLVEAVKWQKALRFLAERRQERPLASRLELIEETSQRFDLSPLEEQFLVERWQEDAERPTAQP
jgi:hypothetical protein